MDKKSLSSKTVKDLKALATELKIAGISKKTKEELINSIIEKSSKQEKKEERKEKKVSAVDTAKTRSKSSEKSKSSQNVQKSETSKVEAQGIQAEPTNDKKEEKTTEQAISSNNPGQQNRPSNQNRNQQNNHNQRRNNNNRSNNQQLQNQGNKSDENLENKEPQFRDESTVEVSGILEVMSDGTHGVLRSPRLIASDKDTYISISQVKKFRLRKGDFVTGIARLPKDNERYYSLLWIKDVNGLTLDKLQNRVNFDDLKPVYPDKQIKLEIGQYPISNRVIDLLAPIGFGQRSMIVAQPKSGKTFLIKDIAKGVNENHPNVQLMVVLIGERPEEVTDIERSVKGIVYASNFDDSPQNQVAVAELSLERAKRMVELGQDVIILMDSLTRLARAYNVALPASGRTLSGGLDPVSLYPSKRFFGAARNFENGASLTIIATSLVDTGSKMDEVIFEEFKGTGNMELKLDRRLANKRVFPAIDIKESGTRNEDLLLGPDKVQISWKMRRMLDNLGQDANEALIDKLKTTKSNEEFTQNLHQY